MPVVTDSSRRPWKTAEGRRQSRLPTYQIRPPGTGHDAAGGAQPRKQLVARGVIAIGGKGWWREWRQSIGRPGVRPGLPRLFRALLLRDLIGDCVELALVNRLLGRRKYLRLLFLDVVLDIALKLL